MSPRACGPFTKVGPSAAGRANPVRPPERLPALRAAGQEHVARAADDPRLLDAEVEDEVLVPVPVGVLELRVEAGSLGAPDTEADGGRVHGPGVEPVRTEDGHRQPEVAVGVDDVQRARAAAG